LSKVEKLVNEHKTAGKHLLRFDSGAETDDKTLGAAPTSID
jgi:hypothetical protein